MAIVQISKIQQRSGNLVDLPQLDEAEFGFASDEKRLFIGKTTENIENIEVLTSYSYIDFNQINGAVGNLDISALSVADGQVLTYDGNNWVNRGGDAGGLITLGDASNVKITGGAIGYVLETDGTGNLAWTAKSSILSYIENITPEILDLNSTNATATTSGTDLITLDDVSGYSVDTCIVFSGTVFGNITASTYYYITYVDLGLGQISISETQGGANLTLTTDTGSMTVNIVGTVVTTTADNLFTDGLNVTITNPIGMTEIDGGSFYIDVLTANTFALYSDPSFLTAFDCTLYTPYAYTSVTATSASTNYITVDDTGSFSQYDSVIFLGTTFGNITAGVTYYIASIVSSTQFTISTTADGGNVVTLTTDSGTAIVYGTGGRAMYTLGGGGGVSTAAGTQYSVQYNNTNLLDGDANFTYNFNTKLLTLAGGNANVGNLNATGIITATRLFSNIANGTPPFEVTSTDRVGNLNVSYSNVTDYSVVTAQSSGTFYPTFVSTNNTGNKPLGVNSLFGFNTTTSTLLTPNLTVNSTINTTSIAATGNITAANIYANSGTIGATLLTGTLTTAAQPNITSFGNSSAITANGSINPSANVTYNLGNNTNRWNDLYLSGSTVYLGNATITSGVSGVVITNADGGTFTISGTGTANSAAIVNGNSNVIVTANANVNISSTGNANILVITGTGANISGTLNVTGNANVGNIGAATGIFTTAANTGLVQNGTSNVTIASGGNVSAFIGGNATAQFVVTSSGANIAGTANVVGNANVGNLGTTTAVITTGNITTINSGLLQNGNSNVTITANGNVSIFVNGNATARAVFTSTGANIAGTANITGNANVGNIGATAGVFTGALSTTSTLSVTGNANVGNIGATSGVLTGTLSVTGNANVGNLGAAQIVATGNISATQFISNIATGAAPIIVSSTTKVANLNADTLDGYDTASTATANTIVVRDANGNITGNNITGTLTTASQNNITSVGTLSSLTVTANTTTGGIKTDNYYYANGVSISFSGTYSNSNVAAYLPTYTGTVGATTLTTGANTTAGSITGNWTLTSGSRLQATYADLAENYTADSNYAPGTVLMFGGTAELTVAENETKKVAGVVSTEPAYVMNSSLAGQYVVTLALMGRVPVKVTGNIERGDMLVSAGNGFAKSSAAPEVGMVIGKALTDFNLDVAVTQLGTIVNKVPGFSYNGPADGLQNFLVQTATSSGNVQGVIEVLVGIG